MSVILYGMYYVEHMNFITRL